MEKWGTKLNRDTSLKKVPYGIRFLQKFKNFYSNKINSLPKKFSFWILISILFVFILPFCLGGVLAYIISKVKMEHLWIKAGLVALILIVTFQVGIGWTKDLLGMNTPPNLIINSPTTEEETKVKGVSTIKISGTVSPTGSTIKINNNIVIVTDDGNFTKEVFINKGENKINIIGKHGSGITEKTVLVYRELAEEEFAEEKRLEEERKVRAEEKRIAREEARRKEILFPVKELINKTPSEIEKITGQKLEIYGKKPSGKLMGAGFTLNGIDVHTVYTLIKNPKVKYNGTISFQIFFDNPLSENKAWRTVDFIPPDKNNGVKNKAFGISDERVTWKNISEIEPFSQISIWYIDNKVNALKFYLLSEEEATPLYQTPL